MKRLRLENREDVQTWRDRLIGKRIVSSDPLIAEHEFWHTKDSRAWEPRIYHSTPAGEGFEKNISFDVQPDSPLLTLPAEIRNRIMEFVLPPHILEPDIDAFGKYQPEGAEATWMNTSAIIFTCKQMYAEGRRLAVEKNTFAYEKFVRKTRLCATRKIEIKYIWDL
ncbi:uncharacterized protein BDR25DRAFT_367949 [Lindgomyces ingoldianus]|uniref:Uncharacterized protein n=1 Tax=Lindgomyces ingoldianus TaxID=673940 RepID=A0ACB6QXG6_9PLEO|nr:uncharacterized protein BDR25DRAFT_367949 [Lindgomyces ingoldianus]KAF2471205.1 hypothetical protein BDR25DRAFT_367949 [Lindgomyces ingoldianus]